MTKLNVHSTFLVLNLSKKNPQNKSRFTCFECTWAHQHTNLFLAQLSIRISSAIWRKHIIELSITELALIRAHKYQVITSYY